MLERTRDVGSSATDASRLPLEILLPLLVSMLILVLMTTAFFHRRCRKKDAISRRLTASQSLLVFSDPEANRQWLDDLKCLKELGLGRLRKAKRACSLGMEVRCRGPGYNDDTVSLMGLPIRPQTAFLSKGRPPRAVVRQSWIQNLLHSGCEKLLCTRPNSASGGQVIPEIRVTVPSMAADEANSLLPQDRRWSRIIAHDIALASDSVSSLTTYSPIPKERLLAAGTATITRSIRHPPNSLHTLPSPARRRLSYAAPPPLYIPVRALSPISESRESLSSNGSSRSTCLDEALDASRSPPVPAPQVPETQCSIMSSYGLALLHSSYSLQTTASGSSRIENPVDSCSVRSAEGVSEDPTSATDSVTGSDLVSSVNPEAAFISCCEDTQTSSPALSAIEPFDSRRMSLSDLSTESVGTSPTEMPQPLRFFVCNPDTSDLYSCSIASLSSVDLDSACRALPTPLIPSTYVDATRVTVPELEALGSRASGGMKTGESSSGLSGVELWVDEDVDLYYYPGPVDTDAY